MSEGTIPRAIPRPSDEWLLSVEYQKRWMAEHHPAKIEEQLSVEDCNPWKASEKK